MQLARIHELVQTIPPNVRLYEESLFAEAAKPWCSRDIVRLAKGLTDPVFAWAYASAYAQAKEPLPAVVTEPAIREAREYLLNGRCSDVLRGKNSYSTRVTDTALGTIRSLESTVQGFEERAMRLESDIKDSQKRATELEAKVGSPFEKEERYHHLARRQSEIEEQLDLTKNQAPSQVDAATTDEREENSEKQTETKSIQQARRAAVRV